jgi:GNAT superfamily N-acetyltransferase
MMIRHGTPADSYGIAKVHVDTWKETYRGLMPDHVLDGLSYQVKAEEYEAQLKNMGATSANSCLFVAENYQNEIVGFSMGGLAINDPLPGFTGELYHIYLLEKYRARGAGKNLFLEVQCWLSERNHKNMFLWALKDLPHIRFYQAMGGLAIHTKVSEIAKPSEKIAFGFKL